VGVMADKNIKKLELELHEFRRNQNIFNAKIAANMEFISKNIVEPLMEANEKLKKENESIIVTN
jgi:hypothetical protein